LAGLGDGVVVRVGDNVRTFDPALTAHVTGVARDLARRDRRFRHVRQLMPGGTCESTIYSLWGCTAAAVCIPLANYHNMGDDARIRPEQVHLDDFENTVKLLIALAAEERTPIQTQEQEKARWVRRLIGQGPMLKGLGMVELPARRGKRDKAWILESVKTLVGTRRDGALT
jgi:hypothetical protein